MKSVHGLFIYSLYSLSVSSLHLFAIQFECILSPVEQKKQESALCLSFNEKHTLGFVFVSFVSSFKSISKTNMKEGINKLKQNK